MLNAIGHVSCILVLLLVSSALSVPLNLCPLGDDSAQARIPSNQPWRLRANQLTLHADPEHYVRFSTKDRSDMFFPSYVASETIRISFRYRSTVKSNVCLEYQTMLRPKQNCRLFRPLPETQTWTSLELQGSVPQQDYDTGTLVFSCPPGQGTLEIRDLLVVEGKPARRGGRPLLLNGKACQAIVTMYDSLQRKRSDLRAALMLRYALYKSEGVYLPIRQVQSPSEIPPCSVLIGRAAEQANLFTSQELKSFTGFTGGHLTRLREHRLGITGDLPGGPQYGVFRLLERLGIIKLGTDVLLYPDVPAYVLPEFSSHHVPAIAFRPLSSRSSNMPELYGGLPMEDVFGNLSSASIRYHSYLYTDSLGYIITPQEFATSHPEFFAMQANGKRMDASFHNGHMQFCYTNPLLRKTIVQRFIDIIRANPIAPYYLLSPGDGSDRYCHCPVCSKIPLSDRLLDFGNAVAEDVGKVFPQKKIMIQAYVDTTQAPTGKQQPNPNLELICAIYNSNFWPATNDYHHVANQRGHQELKGWRKRFPHAGAIVYYGQCGEWMNFWPSFYSDVDISRDFAQHGAKTMDRYGLFSRHANGVLPQNTAFSDLKRYVILRVEMDPQFPVKPAVDFFMKHFYGKAAPAMKDYFDFIMAQPRRVQWTQNCEQRAYGFVTQAMADQAIPLLDKALSLADTETIREWILHEKQEFLWTYLSHVSKARGNVNKKNFPFWARQMAELCRISQRLRCGYAAIDMIKWFKENALYNIGKTNRYTWYSTPEAKALMADPIKALQGSLKNHYRITPEGISIPAAGILGGEHVQNSTWRRKKPHDICILRRQSSGNGLAQTVFNLDKLPEQNPIIYIYGLDNDKEAPALMSIAINGKSIFSGKVPWQKDTYSEKTFTIPRNLLVLGENTLEIRNITPDTEKDGLCGVAFQAKRNYFWGWFGWEYIRIVLK